MKDPNSPEGIKALNYIAWFNGSQFRVPEDATMDLVGQVVKENQTMNVTNIARVKVTMNNTIQENIRQLEQGNLQKENKVDFKGILKQLKQLFCDVRNAKTEYMLLMLFCVCLNIYFLALFNSSQLKGEPLKILSLFGLAEVLGILIGERLVHYVSDTLGLVSSLTIVMVLNIVMKTDIDMSTLYVVFLIDIFFVGAIFNILLIV